MEFEATAAFRELGIRMYNYNPLAGGLLTGKFDGSEQWHSVILSSTAIVPP